MAYCSATDVRSLLNLESHTPSDTVMAALIAKADKEIDEMVISTTKFVERIVFKGDNPFIDLKHDFKEIKKIWFNEEEIKEYNLDNLLSDPDAEEGDASTPEYWTATAGGSDALSWATDKTFIRDRSLKIAKAGAGDSYWSSDGETVSYEQEWVARGRIKVDSNSSTHAYLRLLFKDVDGATEVTHTSGAVTIEITQPASAGTVAVVSASTDDTAQVITIDGLVNSLRTSEALSLNGTTSVTGVKSFSEIYGIRKSADTAGTVTVSRGATTVCTLTAKETSKQDWIEVEIVGETTDDSQTAVVQIFCDATSGDCWGDHFRLFRRQWKPLYASKQVFLLKTPQVGNVVKIEYERSQMSYLVRELSRDLTSMYAIIYIIGGKTAGVNFLDLKKFYAIAQPWKVLYDDCLKRFEANLEKVLSYDQSSPMFIMSKTVN